ncbi:MAG: 2,3-bisphosphoglycerate-independent phosphoglycerate mutase [Candidatus Methanomethylicaceae archaeon]
MVVVDGMADFPLADLGMKTPLEAAEAENFNQIAAMGSSGMMDPVSRLVAPGSDVAHLAILGYDPEKNYTGRGPLEAAGSGIELGSGVAYRCNICELSPEDLILDERVIFKDKVLEEAINRACSEVFESKKVLFKHTATYRGILVLQGEGISQAVRTQQPRRNAKLTNPEAVSCDPNINATAEILRRFMRLSEKVLSRYSNGRKRYVIIPWGGGVRPCLKNFSEIHGLKAAGIAGVPLIKGICKLCGFDLIDVPGATDGPDTDLMAKAHAALKALEEHDFVLIHVEGTDELSHDGDITRKVEMIRKVDTMLGAIMDRVDFDETRIAILSDHTTSSKFRSHTADPVPVAIAGGGYPVDGVKEYSEKGCWRGGLGRFSGRDFLPIFLTKR